MNATWRILTGDCREALRLLPERSVQTCITSPPYFGLRDYGTATWDGGDAGCDHAEVVNARRTFYANSVPGPAGSTAKNAPSRNTTKEVGGECAACGARRVDRQIGSEPSPDEFVGAMVEVFREVRRVLRDDGTVWLNLGDSYCGGGGFAPDAPVNVKRRERIADGVTRDGVFAIGDRQHERNVSGGIRPGEGLKAKDLVGIPWLVAFALRADGWYLRSEIIWHKPNPMPESVTDRPTRSHEQIFLLSKNKTYFYDADAIRETSDREQVDHNLRYAQRYDGPATDPANGQPGNVNNGGIHERPAMDGKRNKRSVWTVTTKPFPGAHFATFPPDLIEPCVLAGSAPWACGECGAPWERVVERGEAVASTRGEQSWTGVTGQRDNPGGGVGNLVPVSRTVDWVPSCEHHDRSGTSVVLDPFAGSGTTGLVAMRHGRSFVGCELNAEYVELARRRIADDAPLFNTLAEA